MNIHRLNYHHLRYFWVVAKEGSIARASKVLHLAHPTISGQVHRLEELLGQKLFTRRGRELVLTDFGAVALRYAEDIFNLGREFLDVASGRSAGKESRLNIGVLDCLAKSMVYRILEPAFRLEGPVRVSVREDNSADAFMGELASHTIDLILTDRPASSGLSVHTFSHLLGECGTAFFAGPALAKSCRKRFPKSMDRAPFLMPGAHSMLRGSLDDWLTNSGLRPQIVADLDDLALAKVVGEAGFGVFAAPDVIEGEILHRYGVQLVGRVAEIRQRYYAVSLERKIKHPAVLAICAAARRDLFA